MNFRSETAPMRRALLRLVERTPVQTRIQFDPLEFPKRFRDPVDVEVVALIAASLAYGRASSFKSKIEQLLVALGPRPSAFARAYAEAPGAPDLGPIVYRFNRPPDFAALVAGVGWMISAHGSLGQRFGALFQQHGLRATLSRFAEELRTAPPVAPLLRDRGERGLRYLLPDASGPGASKRWHLFLRWVVRGPDDVDLGVWRTFMPKAELIIPLDTHIARVARYLGFTTRSDLSWRTAAEITANLRKIDPSDPTRFDFALCHHGMSGACPPTFRRSNCDACPMSGVCRRALGASRGHRV